MIVENEEVNVNTDTMEHQQPKEVNKIKIKIFDNKFIDLFAGTGAFTLSLEREINLILYQEFLCKKVTLCRYTNKK